MGEAGLQPTNITPRKSVKKIIRELLTIIIAKAVCKVMSNPALRSECAGDQQSSCRRSSIIIGFLRQAGIVTSENYLSGQTGVASIRVKNMIQVLLTASTPMSRERAEDNRDL
jgi:hypothetical protein